MVILKTKEYNKVSKHIEILEKIMTKEKQTYGKIIFELMCLYYDIKSREKTSNKLGEHELTVRLYSIMSTDRVIFVKDDFEIDDSDDFGSHQAMIDFLSDNASQVYNIDIYINTILGKYGLIIKTFRDIAKTQEIVNLFKYGVVIDKSELMNISDETDDMEFLRRYVHKTLGYEDLTYSVDGVVSKARKLILAHNTQSRKETFRNLTEPI